MSPPKSFFFSRNGRGLGLSDKIVFELCLSQTGLAKNEKLHQTTSS